MQVCGFWGRRCPFALESCFQGLPWGGEGEAALLSQEFGTPKIWNPQNSRTPNSQPKRMYV